MADQRNTKEVYYISSEFRCIVLQEYHILSPRKYEYYGETSPKKQSMQCPENCSSLRMA